MAKASGANRLRPPYLRVVDGGMHAPLERPDVHTEDRHKASSLLRTTRTLLLLSAGVSGVAAAALSLPVDQVESVLLALLAAGAAATVAALVLVGCVLRHLRRFESPRSTDRRNWPPSAA